MQTSLLWKSQTDNYYWWIDYFRTVRYTCRNRYCSLHCRRGKNVSLSNCWSGLQCFADASARCNNTNVPFGENRIEPLDAEKHRKKGKGILPVLRTGSSNTPTKTRYITNGSHHDSAMEKKVIAKWEFRTDLAARINVLANGNAFTSPTNFNNFLALSISHEKITAKLKKMWRMSTDNEQFPSNTQNFP